MRFSRRELLAGAACLLASPAGADILLLGAGKPPSSAPAWVTSAFPGVAVPTAVFQFDQDRYWSAALGEGAFSTYFSVTRASAGFVQSSAGALTSIASNLPRRSNLGLLVEQSRSNQQLHTEDFTNAAWTKTSLGATANTQVAPDGTTTADTATAAAGASAHFLTQATALNTGTTCIMSVFAKMGTHRYLQLTGGGALFSSGGYANFDLQSGVVSATGGGITAGIEAFTNGWYRCWITDTTTASTTSNATVISLVPASTSVRLESWSAVGTETVHLWGGSLEAVSGAAVPLSYIPSTATPGSRAADVVPFSTMAWYTDGPGTTLSQVRVPLIPAAANKYAYAITNGTTNIRHSSVLIAATNARQGVINNSGVFTLLDSTGGIPAFGASSRQVLAYSNGSTAFQATGGVLATSANAFPSGFTEGHIGSILGANVFLDTYISQLAYWNSRLSNADVGTLVA